MAIQGGKFLTFKVGQEIYGIPIAKVKEIIGMMILIPFAEAVGNLKGLINLRGKIIPVIDLRFKFGLEDLEDSGHNSVIVIETSVSEKQMLAGIMVDSVSEVITIATADIEPPPDHEARSEGDFLAGLGKLKNKVILILDNDKIINREELSWIEKYEQRGEQNV